MSVRPQLLSMLFAVFTLASLTGGCASTSGMANDQNDPYESINRKVFAFNDALDQHFALPAAKVYKAVVPEPARDGIHNALTNLSSPVTLANDILQGDVAHAAQTVGRAVVNSSIGLGGLVDVATPLGIPGHDADFGETLALYGVQEGPYLVLPLMGPSNPRDMAGGLIDIAFDPLTYIGMREKGWWTSGRQVLHLLDERAANIDTLDAVRKSSVDLYATLRSLYRQHRSAQIRGGKPDLQNLPDI